jgi:hypothetical protein
MLIHQPSVARVVEEKKEVETGEPKEQTTTQVS